MASRLCYIAEWLDSASGVVWKYQLFYYPESKEVEVGFFLQPLTDILSATCRRRSNASSHACQWKGERLNFTCLNLEFCFLPCCADGGHQEQEAFLEKGMHTSTCTIHLLEDTLVLKWTTSSSLSMYNKSLVQTQQDHAAPAPRTEHPTSPASFFAAT
eukprot:579612-Pelagomonas_calceolata.AAC.5